MKPASRARVALDHERTVLVVVDVQNDFCHVDGYFAGIGFDVRPCAAAAARIGPVVEQARSLGMRVVWTLSTNASPPEHRLKPERLEDRQGTRSADTFVPGSWGWRLVDGLAPRPEDLVIHKPRYDAFLFTSLEEALLGMSVDTLVVCGVITNCCVDTTARSAFMRGFDVLVLEDCVATFAHERDLHDAALTNLSRLFAVLGDSTTLRAEVTARGPR